MKTVLAILAITLIEIIAILNDTDGYMLGLALVVIAGLGGYSLKKLPWIK